MPNNDLITGAEGGGGGGGWNDVIYEQHISYWLQTPCIAIYLNIPTQSNAGLF